jgi:hypothetical protein
MKIQYEAYYDYVDGLHFSVGNVHCWEVVRGYRTAHLIDGMYCKHKTHTNLEEALYRLRNGDNK